jgi:hypothetical protein
VVVADAAQNFAAAIAMLLGDPALRTSYGTRALDVVRKHFSADACYGPVVAFFGGAHAHPARASVPGGALHPDNVAVAADAMGDD